MIEFLKSFGASGGIAILMLNLIFVLIAVSALIRWLKRRKFKTSKVKKGDIIHNLSDGIKSTVSSGELMSKTVVCLPVEFSHSEMNFIMNWYISESAFQLRASDKMECIVLDEKSPVDGCKYANVSSIPVKINVMDNRTLELEKKTELKTVKLLLLNEWIK